MSVKENPDRKKKTKNKTKNPAGIYLLKATMETPLETPNLFKVNYKDINTAQKIFPLRISLVNVTKSVNVTELGHIY